MPLFNFRQNPQFLAQVFTQYVKAALQILLWTVVGMVSVAGAYVVVRAIWAAVGMIFQAIGI